jgi:phthalate 4,5-cis-dihydrodiol dehydrogenase
LGSFDSSAEESAAKAASARYGGTSRRGDPGQAPNPPFYGLTIVSCEKGDIRQSPDGLVVYGLDERREIPLSTAESGRDHVIQELYDAVVNDWEPLHDGRWGKANLEVCLAVLESGRERKEVYLSHQKATPD